MSTRKANFKHTIEFFWKLNTGSTSYWSQIFVSLSTRKHFRRALKSHRFFNNKNNAQMDREKCLLFRYKGWHVERRSLSCIRGSADTTWNGADAPTAADSSPAGRPRCWPASSCAHRNRSSRKRFANSGPSCNTRPGSPVSTWAPFCKTWSLPVCFQSPATKIKHRYTIFPRKFIILCPT